MVATLILLLANDRQSGILQCLAVAAIAQRERLTSGQQVCPAGRLNRRGEKKPTPGLQRGGHPPDDSSLNLGQQQEEQSDRDDSIELLIKESGLLDGLASDPDCREPPSHGGEHGRRGIHSEDTMALPDE